MSTHVINIIATSNVAPVLAGDTVAAEMNAHAHKNVAKAALEETVATTASSGASKKKTKDTIVGTLAQKQYGRAVSMSTLKLLGLDVAQKQVGYNMLGMSIRVGAWFVPTMLIMATSMLPVIAGLLAIASAAAVATGGIVGLAAVGLWKMSKDQKKGGGFAGARRPYSAAGGGESFLSTLMQPIADVMNDPAFTKQITMATAFIETTFGETIPAAFRAFLNNVDMGVMQMLIDMFTNWLPNAAAGLARWGSELMRTIGGRSLDAVNRFFKYLAGGIQNIAEWLDATGFGQLDALFVILSDVIHKLMELGTSALPTLIHVLNQLWPAPLKPIIEGLAGLFQKLNQSPNALKMITGLIQLFTVLAAFKMVGMLIGGLVTLMQSGLFIGALNALGIIIGSVGLATLGWIAAIAIAVGLLWYYRDSIISWAQRIVNAFLSMFEYLYAKITGQETGTFGEFRDARFERTAGKGYFHDTDFAGMAAARLGREKSQSVTVNAKVDEGVVLDIVNDGLVSEGAPRRTSVGYYVPGQ